MVGGNLLLCFGDREGAKFTFPLKVDKAGKQYLNILGYEHSIYGTMKFYLDGKEIGMEETFFISGTRRSRSLSKKVPQSFLVRPFSYSPSQ